MTAWEHVASFDGLAQADAARAALERRGIAVRLEPDLEPEPRRIDLSVPPEDVDDADIVLNEIYGVAYAERVWPRVDDSAPPPDRGAFCPECGSREVRRLPKLRILLLTIIGMFVLAAISSGATTIGGFFIVLAAAIGVAVADPYSCSVCSASWR